MQQVIVALGLGAASGVLGIATYRLRLAWLGWLTLAPLAAAVYLYPPVAAGLAGGVCGSLVVGGSRLTSMPANVPHGRLIEGMMALGHGLVWGVIFALAAWLWPDGVPAWGAVVMPAAAAAIAWSYRVGAPRFGAPRFWSWFHGSQDGALPVIHISRLGSDLVIPALLALAAVVPVVVLVQLPPSGPTVATAVASVLAVAGALGFGIVSYRRTVARVDAEAKLCVAAVAAAPVDFDPRSPDYRDVEGLIGRYQPFVARAISAGAQLIVLPEGAAVVTSVNRKQWLDVISTWAVEAKARVVAGLSEDLRTNELVIADESGRIAAFYQKQHPAFFGEPRPSRRMPPALAHGSQFDVSAVTCVDLDYSDLVRPVASAGGVLAVPAHDWEEIFEMHSRCAVWSAVMAGVPVVRSAGHGISIVYDAAGRVVARATSHAGPAALIANVPISMRAVAAIKDSGSVEDDLHIARREAVVSGKEAIAGRVPG